ncbi:MAG: BREX-1 system phosphatase PglZ type B [Actinomycetota bacterium]
MTDTFLDVLAAGLGRAGSKGSPDQEAPAAVLWPDKERQFEAIVPRLRTMANVLTLGEFKPDVWSGPAIWVRCLLASQEAPVIVYMPGWTRDDVRVIAECPEELQPLADVHFRGAYWLQSNGRDWTIAALLENSGVGVGVRVAGDHATKEALRRVLGALADETVDSLKARGEIDSAVLNAMLTPDPVRQLLVWMSDPSGFKASADRSSWEAFAAICRSSYGLDPDDDGPLTAAEKLGHRKPPWDAVWERFSESPVRYEQIITFLEQAQPATLLEEHPDSWPAFNTSAEDRLREGLAKLRGLPANDAISMIDALEIEHAERRGWVWAKINRAPLAQALEPLTELAAHVPFVNEDSDPVALAQAYADEGWRTDACVIEALAAVVAPSDRDAVATAIDALYRSWLDRTARALQEACVRSAAPLPRVESWAPGTCLIFVDGLRFDVGMRLAAALNDEAEVSVDWSFAAVPTITATAKRAVSPIGDQLVGGSSFDPSERDGGPALSHEAFKKLLIAAGWQYLGETWGDVSGRGWLECGDVDEQGHTLPMKFPNRLQTEVIEIAEQVRELLAFGWKRVVVLTDHGWLYLPGGLPKVQQSIAALDKRKGRCGRLSPGATTQFETLPWHFDPSVRIAFAPGIACFEEGKIYEHGGVSPQECVTPVVSVVAKAAAMSAAIARIVAVRWTGLRCRIEVEGAPEGASVDIRTKPGDPTSSVTGGPKACESGSAAPIVPDDSNEGLAAAVVVLAPDGSVLAQAPTTVGGVDD